MAKNSNNSTKITEKTLSKKEVKLQALGKNLRENLLRRKQKTKNSKSKGDKND